MWANSSASVNETLAQLCLLPLPRIQPDCHSLSVSGFSSLSVGFFSGISFWTFEILFFYFSTISFFAIIFVYFWLCASSPILLCLLSLSYSLLPGFWVCLFPFFPQEQIRNKSPTSLPRCVCYFRGEAEKLKCHPMCRQLDKTLSPSKFSWDERHLHFPFWQHVKKWLINKFPLRWRAFSTIPAMKHKSFVPSCAVGTAALWQWCWRAGNYLLPFLKPQPEQSSKYLCVDEMRLLPCLLFYKAETFIPWNAALEKQEFF